MAENLLSVKEVAEKRGVTVWRIHQLIKAGTLPAEKYGTQYLIKIKDADALTIHGKPGRPAKEKKDIYNAMSENLRKNERINISLEAILEFSSGKREVRVSDLSIGGCFIDSIGQVLEGELVIFTVRMSTDQWLKLNGKVTFVLPNSGFGLSFTDLTEEEQNIIQQLILEHKE